MSSVCPINQSIPSDSVPDFSAHGGSQWFAVHVRSNFERFVAAVLHSKGYNEFLPTYRRRRQWSDRVKEQDLPLFPGYLFCRFDYQNRLPIISTSGVVCIAGLGRDPVPMQRQQLEAIWRITHCELSVSPWPLLEVGDRVLMTGGPLRGIEGLLIESKSSYRLVVSVTLLQRSVSVEVDHDWIQPLVEVHPIARRLAAELTEVSQCGAVSAA